MRKLATSYMAKLSTTLYCLAPRPLAAKCFLTFTNIFFFYKNLDSLRGNTSEIWSFPQKQPGQLAIHSVMEAINCQVGEERFYHPGIRLFTFTLEMASTSQQQYWKEEDDGTMSSKFWGKIMSSLEPNHMFIQGWRQNKGILEHATFQENCNYCQLSILRKLLKGYANQNEGPYVEKQYKDDWILVYRGRDGGTGKPRDNKLKEQTDPG